ncbi:isochorismatase [Apiospora arundinis]
MMQSQRRVREAQASTSIHSRAIHSNIAQQSTPTAIHRGLFAYPIQYNHLEKRLWVCKQCVYLGCKRPTARASKGTQNIVNHLFTEHGVSAPVGKGQGTAEKKHHAKNYQAQVQPKQRSITQLLGLDTMTERDQQIANKLVKSFDKQHFQRLVVQWLVDANKPFTEAEDPHLRAVFDYLNPSVAKRKAHLVDTSVRRLIDQQYTKHKGEVIATLKRAPGKIHISFDGWTSRTRQPLYGIACFFRNESNKPQKVIISVPELAERHTGESIAAVVVQLDETPIYYIALALHPGYGWAWFEDQWEARPGWVAHAKAIVRGVWETEYQSKPIPESGIIRDLDPVLMAYDDKERIDKVASIVDDEERAKQAVGWAWSGGDVVSDKVSDEASDDEII